MSESKIGLILGSIWEVVCYDVDGKEKWREVNKNLVVDTGLDDVLSNYFKGSGYTAAHYVGLKDTGTVVAGDTMASHSGWAELAIYSESVRQTLTLGTVASKSVDNSASKATFTINASDDVYGAFLTTNNTKSGTTGVLYGAVDFSSAQSVVSGDVLLVTVTLTSAAS
jgi:hypothetical protein|tara:strand:+ start:288 stop:791 length:504 start_codon:yes stop_codon:yes gene_type:complete